MSYKYINILNNYKRKHFYLCIIVILQVKNNKERKKKNIITNIFQILLDLFKVY